MSGGYCFIGLQSIDDCICLQGHGVMAEAVDKMTPDN
jgi:hypothetical protein